MDNENKPSAAARRQFLADTARMACGVGACVGCAVAVKDGKGGKIYKRVCVDGPVFELKDVIWE